MTVPDTLAGPRRQMASFLMDHGRLIRRSLVAAGLGLVGLLTLGLPGFAVLGSASLLVDNFDHVPLAGDQVWPTALGISMLGPLALIPADMIIARPATSRWTRILLVFGFTFVMDVVVVAIGLLLNGAAS